MTNYIKIIVLILLLATPYPLQALTPTRESTGSPVLLPNPLLKCESFEDGHYYFHSDGFWTDSKDNLGLEKGSQVLIFKKYNNYELIILNPNGTILSKSKLQSFEENDSFISFHGHFHGDSSLLTYYYDSNYLILSKHSYLKPRTLSSGFYYTECIHNKINRE